MVCVVDKKWFVWGQCCFQDLTVTTRFNMCNNNNKIIVIVIIIIIILMLNLGSIYSDKCVYVCFYSQEVINSVGKILVFISLSPIQ